MEIIESDITIIGAGLTGLSIAYRLRGKQLDIRVIEARDRLGGRICTSYVENQASVEAGATWLGRKHQALVNLLQELGINIFEQELGERAIYEPISTSPHQIVSLPPNTDPSYRIKGGTSTLIQALAKSIPSDRIHTGQVVQSIEEVANGLLVKSDRQTFKSKIVVSTLPPNLFCSTITVDPSLPESLTAVAKATHTWMGESIKIGLRYEKPFWRRGNSSGTIVSNVGPITEMYDHSDFADTHYALKGFLNGSYYPLSREERLGIVLDQLGKYYGKEAAHFSSYEELVWRKEPFTYAEYGAHVLPHQYNGHAVYQQAYLNGKLFIAGSETAAQFPGYMDGAVGGAAFVCRAVEKFYLL